MSRLMNHTLALIISCFAIVPCVAQCGFEIVPAAGKNWYRSEGWIIPGLSDAKGFAKINRTVDGSPKTLSGLRESQSRGLRMTKTTTFYFPRRSSMMMARRKGCFLEASNFTQCCGGNERHTICLLIRAWPIRCRLHVDSRHY